TPSVFLFVAGRQIFENYSATVLYSAMLELLLLKTFVQTKLHIFIGNIKKENSEIQKFFLTFHVHIFIEDGRINERKKYCFVFIPIMKAITIHIRASPEGNIFLCVFFGQHKAAYSDMYRIDTKIEVFNIKNNQTMQSSPIPKSWKELENETQPRFFVVVVMLDDGFSPILNAYIALVFKLTATNKQ
ncbi:hypothetical protein ACJX0J_029849, partial [Zea mays]